jgi:hypothetical protein
MPFPVIDILLLRGKYFSYRINSTMPGKKYTFFSQQAFKNNFLRIGYFREEVKNKYGEM